MAGVDDVPCEVGVLQRLRPHLGHVGVAPRIVPVDGAGEPHDGGVLHLRCLAGGTKDDVQVRFDLGDDAVVVHRQQRVGVVEVHLDHRPCAGVARRVGIVVQLGDVEPGHADVLVEAPARVGRIGRVDFFVQVDPRGKYRGAAEVRKLSELGMASERGRIGAHHTRERCPAHREDHLVHGPRSRFARRSVLTSHPDDPFAGIVQHEALRPRVGREGHAPPLHALQPGGEYFLPDVPPAPAHVEAVLVAQHEKVRHPERRRRAALRSRSEEPREDHRLEDLLVRPLAHAQPDAQVPEGHAVVPPPRLLRVVELAEGEDERQGGRQVQRSQLLEAREQRLPDPRRQLRSRLTVHGPRPLQTPRAPLALLRVSRQRILVQLQRVQQPKDITVLRPKSMLARLRGTAPSCARGIRHQPAGPWEGIDDRHADALSRPGGGEGVRTRETAPTRSDDQHLAGGRSGPLPRRCGKEGGGGGAGGVQTALHSSGSGPVSFRRRGKDGEDRGGEDRHARRPRGVAQHCDEISITDPSTKPARKFDRARVIRTLRTLQCS
mmetsp:Transcript_6294/g.13191  ORF Transcript_6294/g.13191 Transcript_6294/m.13191 type:complete len:549 (+) Transcript_6294:304-1950(+)